MNTGSFSVTVGKAFLRLLILGLIWSVFFGLYELSGYHAPSLVSIILFLLCAYAVVEVLSTIADGLLSKKGESRKPLIHDRVEHNNHHKQK